MDRVESLLQEFTEANGIPGFEGEIFRLMDRHLSKHADVEKDRLGSFIARLRGGKERPRVMLAAHMDEIGFLVSHFTGSFVRFSPLGGWWFPRMLGLPVTIKTSRGDVTGVVASKSPFAMDDEERKRPIKSDELYIDVGLTGGASPEKLGLRPGDPVTVRQQFTLVGGGKSYLAKAFDDRAGCVMVVECLTRLARLKLPNAVYGVGTVQEEVGLRGAVTSGHRVNPDVCLILEVNIAQDLPGFTEGHPAKLGAGVSISIFDATLIPNAKLRDLAASVAKKRKIPFHFSAIAVGGTDGGRVHLNAGGVPTLVLGVPTRHIHSAGGILCRADLDATVKLVVEMVKALDAKTVAGLV